MDDELRAFLTKIDKKLDKTLNLMTKIAKTLHLLPVTEREERALRLLQRDNMAVAAKIDEELDGMSPKRPDSSSQLSIMDDVGSLSEAQVYEGVIGDDFIA